MDKYKRNANESKEEYIFRISQYKIEDSLTNQDIANIVNNELGTNFRESYIRAIYSNMNKGYELALEKMKNKNEYLDELEEKRLEVQAERYKKAEINKQLNAKVRNNAREELWFEQINNSIKELKPLKVVEKVNNWNKDRVALLNIADIHYGKIIEILGLHGEIISEYNKQICEECLFSICYETKRILKEKNITDLRVFMLGDYIENILRMSSIRHLEEDVVDSVIGVAELIANTLNELSTFANVECYMVGGNHDIERKLTNNVTFDTENVTRIIYKFVELRLKDNPNIVLHQSQGKEEICYCQIFNYNVVGIHGENKNLKNTLNYLQNLYRIKIDYIFAGHYHSFGVETVSLNGVGSSMAIRCPSVVSTDGYAKKLQKSSSNGALLAIFDYQGLASFELINFLDF